MLENTSTQAKTAWFFVSRLFILAGMVLFFSSLGLAFGALMSNIIFGVDVINEPSIFSTFSENPAALNAVKLLQVIITIGGMVIPAFLFPRAIGQNTVQFLQLSGKIRFSHICCAIALILVSAPMVSWLVEMNARLQFPSFLAELEAKLKASEEAAAQLTEAFIKSTTAGDLLLNILVVAIIPAVAEELLFRGALQRFFSFCFKNIHVAVILSAALFSAFHGQIYGFMPRWVLGILLGYLFAYSGSVWPGVLAHFINNTLSLLIAHFKMENTTVEFLNDTYQFPTYIILMSLFCCLLILYFMNKTQSKTTLTHGEQLD